jgi:hypothetical protein
MRSCIEGVPPPSANKRKDNDPMKPAVNAFKRKYSQILLEAVDWSMEPDQRLRPQSCDELLAMLKKMPDENESKSFLSKLKLDQLSDMLPWKK